MAPTATDLKTVHDQWNGTDKDAFIEAFYKEMFATHPDFRALFKNQNGDPCPSEATWKKQFTVTRDALDKAIKLGDGDVDGLKTALHALAQKHVAHDVGQTHFQAVKGVLDTVVASHIDGADTAAFSAVFGFVLDHLA